jgi:hypothetical protein
MGVNAGRELHEVPDMGYTAMKKGKRMGMDAGLKRGATEWSRGLRGEECVSMNKIRSQYQLN